LKGARIAVPQGAELVPGLTQALRAARPKARTLLDYLIEVALKNAK